LSGNCLYSALLSRNTGPFILQA